MVLEEDHENKRKNLCGTIKQEIEEFNDEIQLQITAHKAKQLRKRLSDVEKEYTIMEQERTRSLRPIKAEMIPEEYSGSGLPRIKSQGCHPMLRTGN
ncbi:hypothetical protein JTE90_007778 [Oedothorax gibbosus]|uniref:Uncharacterized protein n=1 Tax=Oedothorax gibbosus TaxID=931172 RepID=A0AAV6TPN5_9ARAC|nr:hypothetical protein JTE90_007778 [Oedothorax gibbosus]